MNASRDISGCRTLRFAILLLLAFSVLSSRSAQAQDLAAHWTFDETQGSIAQDSVGAASGTITGIFLHVPGVLGDGIEMDGSTSAVTVPAKDAPKLKPSFTIESWVAINAYPWNWVPVVDQRKKEQTGYFFGIDSLGRVGFELSVGGHWEFLTSEEKLPLKQWAHIAATFSPTQGMKLYINGKQIAEHKTEGSFLPADGQDLLIGRVRYRLLPAHWLHPKYRVWYSFDGILDDVKLIDGALGPTQIAETYASAHAPTGKILPDPKLPSGPRGPISFGAYYTKLHYTRLWDAPRRVGPDSDVVVGFGDLPVRFVSWQGTNHVPAWVTENGKWFTDEFVESGGSGCPDGGDCEPMSDKHNRYAHVRILESTPARVVIQVRYGQCEVEHSICADPDPFTGWTDIADDYYTIYPDGVAARHSVAWTTNPETSPEFQETIVINPPGTKPEDNIQTDAHTLVNLKGETHTYSWTPPPAVLSEPVDANIQVVNLKSQWKPFEIVSPVHPKIKSYIGEPTYSIFEWWNHWPVAEVKSSGISAFAPGRPSHSSLSHIEGQPYAETWNSITKIMLDGLTNRPPAELVPLAKSWLSPASLSITSGAFKSLGYDPTQRAFVLERQGKPENGSLSFRLAANNGSPLVNPAFVIRGWGDAVPRLRINGKQTAWGKYARYGVVNSIGLDKLVIWIREDSTTPVTIQIKPGKSAADR